MYYKEKELRNTTQMKLFERMSYFNKKGASTLPNKKSVFNNLNTHTEVIPDDELNLEQDFNRGGNWADDFCKNLLRF